MQENIDEALVEKKKFVISPLKVIHCQFRPFNNKINFTIASRTELYKLKVCLLKP